MMDDLIAHYPEYRGLTRAQAAQKLIEIKMQELVDLAKQARDVALEVESASTDLMGS